MAKLQDYEVRPRGEFMLEGKVVRVANHESALFNPMDDIYTDSIVIEIATGNWWLMLADPGAPISVDVMSTETIHPYYRDPSKRVALARACEDTCQIEEVALSMGFSDFERQLKAYEKEGQNIKLLYMAKRMAAEKNSIIKVAECLKESGISEVAIIAGDNEKAKATLQNALDLLDQAEVSSQASHIPSNIVPNPAEQAVAKARVLLDITAKFQRKMSLKSKSNTLEMA